MIHSSNKDQLFGQFDFWNKINLKINLGCEV